MKYFLFFFGLLVSNFVSANSVDIELKSAAKDVIVISTSKETRRIDVKPGDEVDISLIGEVTKAEPKQKKECKSAFGKTECGYNCVSAFGEIECADTPDQKCLAQFGEIECGYDCKAAGGKIECADKPDQKCLAEFGEVKCGYDCKAAGGKIKCASKPEGKCVVAYGDVKCSD
jgi:hypothetical protein